MTDNYEHYISRNIVAFYKRMLFSPIMYLAILIILWIILPLSGLLIPKSLSEDYTVKNAYEKGDKYIQSTFKDLTFTGYTSSKYFRTNGYYYYAKVNGKCLIFLLSPSACEQGLPQIDSIHIKGKLAKSDQSYQALLANLASDMKWTQKGITKQMPKYYIDQPATNSFSSSLLFFVYFATGLYSLISIILYSVYIRFPMLSPACQNLIVFTRHPIKMFEEAEEELATLPQLATEDMFITEHYFIMSSPYGNSIVPIKEILWIYKHSTLHKFLWYHFSISYTMHITANKHLYLHCPKNIKSDIDGIMDYLAEANHNILVGFSEENRLKVEKVLGKPFHIEKINALLHKRI